MRIIDISAKDIEIISQSGEMLSKYYKTLYDSELIKDEILRILESGGICKVCYDHEDRPIGIIIGEEEYKNDVWEIEYFLVEEEFRQNGLGTLLLLQFEKELCRKKINKIIFIAKIEGNPKKKKLFSFYGYYIEDYHESENIKNIMSEIYESLGFELIEIIPDIDGEESAGYIYGKEVRNSGEIEEELDVYWGEKLYIDFTEIMKAYFNDDEKEFFLDTKNGKIINKKDKNNNHEERYLVIDRISETYYQDLIKKFIFNISDEELRNILTELVRKYKKPEEFIKLIENNKKVLKHWESFFKKAIKKYIKEDLKTEGLNIKLVEKR